MSFWYDTRLPIYYLTLQIAFPALVAYPHVICYDIYVKPWSQLVSFQAAYKLLLYILHHDSCLVHDM